MQKTRKAIYASLFAIVALCGAMTTQAFAATTLTEPLDLTSQTSDVTADSYTWDYDEGGSTLTITGDLTINSSQSGIVLPGNTSVIVNSPLSITSDWDAINASGNLVMDVNAETNIFSSSYDGIEATGDMSLTIKEGVEVSIASDEGLYGLRVGDAGEICCDGSLTIDAKNGIYAKNGISFCNSAASGDISIMSNYAVTSDTESVEFSSADGTDLEITTNGRIYGYTNASYDLNGVVVNALLRTGTSKSNYVDVVSGDFVPTEGDPFWFGYSLSFAEGSTLTVDEGVELDWLDYTAIDYANANIVNNGLVLVPQDSDVNKLNFDAWSGTGVIAVETATSDIYEYYDNDGTLLYTNGTWGQDGTWTLIDGTLTVLAGEVSTDIPDYTTGAETGVSSAPWGEYAASEITSVVLDQGVTGIGNNAFRACYKLTSVVIPDSIASIGDSAFCNCISLTEITIPDSVTYIGKQAFASTELTSVVIPDSVTRIEEYAFANCFSLASVTIPDSITSIGEHAFSCCHRLTAVTIPSSVTSIEASAFSYSARLLTVKFEGACDIADDAFSNCTELIQLAFSDDFTSQNVNIAELYSQSGTSRLSILYDGSDQALFDDLAELADQEGGSVVFWYAVTFDSNGGTAVASADRLEYGKAVKINEPTDPTKEGYIFTGWYADEGLTEEFDFSTEITSPFTLYAGWTAEEVDPGDGGDDAGDDGDSGDGSGDDGDSGSIDSGSGDDGDSGSIDSDSSDLAATGDGTSAATMVFAALFALAGASTILGLRKLRNQQ